MQSDRELLELAAKAAGFGLFDIVGACVRCDTDEYWNPLANDGDALRLAVRLRLSVDFAPHDVGPYVRAWRHSVEMQYAPVSIVQDYHAADGDPYAAARRAVVRAAAQIGEGVRDE